MKMSDIAAIITGGASGLGEATARQFISAGAQVTLLDRDAERGNAVAADMGATFAQTDVTDEASVAAAIQTAKEAMGKINATVNCAGIGTAEKTLHKKVPTRSTIISESSTSIWWAASTSHVSPPPKWPPTHPMTMARAA